MVKKKIVKKVVKKPVEGTINFVAGMKYPWGKAKRLLYILLILLPILGWFALLGYCKKIIRSLVEGNTQELPEFGGFWDNFKSGFWVFVLLIPLIIVVSILSWIPVIGPFVNFIASVFFVPYLFINFLVKEDFEATFEIKKTAITIFENIGDYIVAYLKTLAFVVIYAILSIILIGIPCLYLGQYFYLADFYRRHP